MLKCMFCDNKVFENEKISPKKNAFWGGKKRNDPTPHRLL